MCGDQTRRERQSRRDSLVVATPTAARPDFLLVFAVVPAHAGTHSHRSNNAPLHDKPAPEFMGPRVRGDDASMIDSTSLYVPAIEPLYQALAPWVEALLRA